MIIFLFIVFAMFVLFLINKMTNTLCLQREIPEEKQPDIFRTVNVMITILLITSYLELIYTY